MQDAICRLIFCILLHELHECWLNVCVCAQDRYADKAGGCLPCRQEKAVKTTRMQHVSGCFNVQGLRSNSCRSDITDQL